MAVRSTNTMAEGLQKVLADISALKTTPDADVSFLIGLETTILQELRRPMDEAAGQMAQAQSPGNSVAMGAADMGAGVADMGMGAALMNAGAGGGIAPGSAVGSPGPGSPLPSLAGLRSTPDAMRQALRPSIQGG